MKVEGWGFRVQGSCFMVQGSGFSAVVERLLVGLPEPNFTRCAFDGATLLMLSVDTASLKLILSP